jgi:short-subunit dehydrogenase
VRLPDAVVVVTGASSGIGRATALAFARRGCHVVVAARREDLLNELAAEIGAHGRQAEVVLCDVTDLEQVRRLAVRTEEAFGRCDVLVNNAGIPGGGPFADLSMDQIERIVRVNYLGLLYCTKAFLPMMLAAGRGHVVNVASLAGRFAVPGSSVYSSTKHAVVAFSEALHFELAPRGILVTAVNPGLVATEGFPHRDAIERGRRVMQPDAVARTIVRVVMRGIAPERSMPRWLAALQAVRVLAPPLYRFGLRQAVKRAYRPTKAGRQ